MKFRKLLFNKFLRKSFKYQDIQWTAKFKSSLISLRRHYVATFFLYGYIVNPGNTIKLVLVKDQQHGSVMQNTAFIDKCLAVRTNNVQRVFHKNAVIVTAPVYTLVKIRHVMNRERKVVKNKQAFLEASSDNVSENV